MGRINRFYGDQYLNYFGKCVCSSSINAIEGYSSPNGIYSLDHLSTVVFAVNTKLEKELGFKIESHEDLLNPKLKGKILFSNPNKTLSGWNNLCNIMAVFGTDSKETWDFNEQLMSNIVIVDDSNSCLEFMETGDYVVGLTCENEAIKIFKNDDIDYFEIRYSKNGTSALRMVWRLLKEVKILKSQKNWWNMFIVLKEQVI